MIEAAAHRVEIPEAPILETFRAVFEQSVASLETTADRSTLLEAWPLLAAGPEFHALELGRADEILERGLNLLDESRGLPEPGRHFLRVALLQALARVRLCQRRETEARMIRVAAEGYVRDHLRLDRHALHGFLLFFQASRSSLAELDTASSEEPFDLEEAPFKAELPIC